MVLFPFASILSFLQVTDSYDNFHWPVAAVPAFAVTVSALGDAAVLDAAVTVAQVGALAIFLVRSTALQEVAMTTPGQTYGMDALTGFFGVRLPP